MFLYSCLKVLHATVIASPQSYDWLPPCNVRLKLRCITIVRHGHTRICCSQTSQYLGSVRQAATDWPVKIDLHGLDFCHATLWHSRPASPVYRTLLQLHRAGWEIEPGGI